MIEGTFAVTLDGLSGAAVPKRLAELATALAERANADDNGSFDAYALRVRDRGQDGIAKKHLTFVGWYETAAGHGDLSHVRRIVRRVALAVAPSATVTVTRVA